MRIVLAGVVLGACLLAVPRPAAADLFVAPYAGVNFAGHTVDPRVNVGATLTWLGPGRVGAEIDVAFIPDFFAPRDAPIDLLGSNNVTTVMANLVVGRHRGALRPYVSAGGGLIRSQVGTFGAFFGATNHGGGVNAGAGALVGAGRFAIRVDARYFRQLTGVERLFEDELADFAFWRATAGLSIAF